MQMWIKTVLFLLIIFVELFDRISSIFIDTRHFDCRLHLLFALLRAPACFYTSVRCREHGRLYLQVSAAPTATASTREPLHFFLSAFNPNSAFSIFNM
ncbi:MAG: hypothetical protein LBE57_03195 [Methanosarcinales archaeon]|jgi:hypothetical protein|nr:hypothetical protein [Methanosarcinales archaeon]